ncbi:MAG: YeeE/YedE family protein [Burkholderiaceae bacterium]
MSEIEFAALGERVVWLTFAIAIALGAIMARSRFCTMGAIADIVNMHDWSRMRMWACAIGVAVLGTQALAASGLVDIGASMYTTPRLIWLSYIVGGLLFGFGMVLASGCTSKTLLRIGGGSLKSLVVFVVLGLAAYMTLRGIFGVFRAGVLDPVAITLEPGQDLPSLLGGGPALRYGLGAAFGLALLAFALVDREFRRFELLLGGFGIGLAVVALWYVSGHVGHVEENPFTLEETFVRTNSGRPESFTFVAPMAYTLELLMFWSDASKAVSVGIAAALGVVVGAFAYSIIAREFHWEGFGSVEDTANHLVGGALMGVGGVTGLGCTVGQGITGLSTLSLGSMLAFGAILAGGFLGVQYQAWRTDRLLESLESA